MCSCSCFSSRSSCGFAQSFSHLLDIHVAPYYTLLTKGFQYMLKRQQSGPFVFPLLIRFESRKVFVSRRHFSHSTLRIFRRSFFFNDAMIVMSNNRSNKKKDKVDKYREILLFYRSYFELLFQTTFSYCIKDVLISQ